MGLPAYQRTTVRADLSDLPADVHSAGLTAQIAAVQQRIDIARIEGQVKASSVKKVADFVQSHPDEAAGILRTWVAEG